jgi:hypothetical protein
MIHGLFADLTLLLHLAFVLFVVAGGLLVRRWPRLLLAHLAAAAWGVFIAASSGTCPLTPLENWFSAQAGRAGYRGGFLEHYLGPVLYPEGLTRERQWAEVGVVVLVNGIVYGPRMRRWWRRRGRGRGQG